MRFWKDRQSEAKKIQKHKGILMINEQICNETLKAFAQKIFLLSPQQKILFGFVLVA